jgi:magnesium chelatase subunit I
LQQPTTLGALKKSGYKPRTIKEELRANLITKIKAKEIVFPGIFGFDDTVLPDIERAILSKHSILLLGLRGQAKTRIARQLVHLLDEYIPVVAGSELNDDPLAPISRFALELIAEHGDKTPITWLHRDARYVEKLATPDVSIADLLGDIDPIKAANQKLSYADERAIHFGMIPRAHRCIFVINELPDLQARIQVALFNALQEQDMQIRGFKLRLPIEVQFVFTANPEDYTNRGSIITPLKDRIQSQITTHYPTALEVARQITEQEAKVSSEQKKAITVPDMLRNLVEEIAFQARESEFVDKNSGVSARLTISALENLYSSAERRMLRAGETKTTARLTDFWGVIPAITGKVEMVYEGEQEGPQAIAMTLIGAAVKKMFLEVFPNPEKLRKGKETDEYGVVRAWFAAGNATQILTEMPDSQYMKMLDKVAGLRELAAKYAPTPSDVPLYQEWILNALTEFEMLQKDIVQSKVVFKDFLAGDIKDDDIDGEIDLRGYFN